MAELIIGLVKEILAVVRIAMEGQPPEVRAELWRIFLDDLQAWREFWAPVVRLWSARE